MEADKQIPIPAFPTQARQGMSLRDYFAAEAMAAMLANPACDLHPTNEVAPAAWRMADAMLKARCA